MPHFVSTTAPLLLLLSASASVSAEVPIIPAFFTGERLYEICKGRDEPRCWMYVAGVLDGVFEAETGAEARTLCRTEITNRDAAEHVIDYLRDNEEIRTKAAAVAVRLALQSELKCATEG